MVVVTLWLSTEVQMVLGCFDNHATADPPRGYPRISLGAYALTAQVRLLSSI